MQTILALLLLTAFPSTDRVSWMRPESFRLAIGMSRAEAAGALGKYAPKKGKSASEMIVDYDSDKALTLEFRNDRLHSIRFELFVFLPEIRAVFDQERKYLDKTFGPVPKSTSSILIYDNALPNVMVVATDDPKSENGRKGLGVLAVRYYDPR